MTGGERRVARSKIDAPLGEGVDGDNRLEWSGMNAHFLGKYLAGMTLLDDIDIIFEDRRPEVSCT